MCQLMNVSSIADRLCLDKEGDEPARREIPVDIQRMVSTRDKWRTAVSLYLFFVYLDVCLSDLCISWRIYILYHVYLVYFLYILAADNLCIYLSVIEGDCRLQKSRYVKQKRWYRHVW